MHYLVDRNNVIVDVDDCWNQEAAAADEQGGSARERIIGQPLEAFMVGDTTRMFVRSALDAARILGHTRALPYRCDSAHEHRRFEMVISPMGQGLVRVEHTLIEAWPRASRAPRALSAGRVRGGWRCSQCLLVRLSGQTEWQETDLEASAMLAQDVCPACSQRLFTPVASHQPA